MEHFSYIEGDRDVAMTSYAQNNSPTSVCTWQDGGLDHIFRYYNKQSKRVALDLGASYGFFTVGFAQHFETVHSFEINSSILPHLKMNTSEYRNVTIHEHGVSDIEGDVSVLDHTHSGYVRISEDGGVLAKVRTLDSFNFEGVDLIKMDVEDSEYEVFKGAVATISNNRPVLLFEWNCSRDLVNENKRQWVFDLLYSLKYRFVDYRHNDFLFIPE